LGKNRTAILVRHLSSKKKDILSLGQEDSVFISMVVRGGSVSCVPNSQLASGLRAAKMDDNLSMERMKTIAVLTGDHPQLCPAICEITMLGRTIRGAGSKQRLKP
jgi:hypothetical protein